MLCLHRLARAVARLEAQAKALLGAEQREKAAMKHALHARHSGQPETYWRRAEAQASALEAAVQVRAALVTAPQSLPG